MVRRVYSLTMPSMVEVSHWAALPFVTSPMSTASTCPPAASTR